jgi:hypothetical protein
VYGRGRPRKDGTRRRQGTHYRVRATVTENEGAVAKLRETAGCFVLLTTIPVTEKSGQDILTIYKEQDGIERNFGFLKDPLVVNDVFLKLQGWNNRNTVKPTSLMVVSKFSPVFVGINGNQRFLFTPLDTVQLSYLKALEVHPAVFTSIDFPVENIRSGYH